MSSDDGMCVFLGLLVLVLSMRFKRYNYVVIASEEGVERQIDVNWCNVIKSVHRWALIPKRGSN